MRFILVVRSCFCNAYYQMSADLNAKLRKALDPSLSYKEVTLDHGGDVAGYSYFLRGDSVSLGKRMEIQNLSLKKARFLLEQGQQQLLTSKTTMGANTTTNKTAAAIKNDRGRSVFKNDRGRSVFKNDRGRSRSTRKMLGGLPSNSIATAVQTAKQAADLAIGGAGSEAPSSTVINNNKGGGQISRAPP